MSEALKTDREQSVPGSDKKAHLWRTVAACVVLFVLAFGLRWTHLRAAEQTVYPEELAFLEDSRYYATWSEQIAEGQLVGKHSFFMGPLYPYSLAIIRPLAGASPVLDGNGRVRYDFAHAYLVQALFGALSCLLVFTIARQMLGEWQAWLAGALVAGQRVFIYFDGLLMPSSQALFVLLATLALLIRAMKRTGLSWWLASGVAIGLGALAKGPSLLLLPGACLWLLFGLRDNPWRQRLVECGAVLLGCLPVVLLATAHNFAADGDFVPLTSNAGANLWIGNGPDASGAHAGVTTRFPSAKLDFYMFGAERGPEEPPASVVSEELSREAREFMASQPGATLGLLWKKFRMFWSASEVGTSDQFEFFKRYSPVLSWPLPGVGLIAPFGLLGFVLMLKHWRRFWPLHLLILTQAGSFTVFFVLGRYRLASVACLVLLAVAAVDWGLVAFGAKRWKALGGALLALVPCLLLVHWPVDGMGPERGFANQHYFLARQAEKDKRNPIQHYRDALESEWREGDFSLRQKAVTHIKIGNALLLNRKRKRAATEYRNGLEVCEKMSPEFRYREPLIAELRGRLSQTQK